VLVCAIAGAFAVPANATVTPVSSVVAALVGLLGLQVWAWSHLPQRMRGEPRQGVVRIVQPVVWLGLGLAVGLLLLGALRIIIQPTLPSIGARIAQAGSLPVWRRLLIIYVAAVSEELLFRLLLLSAIAGLTARLLRLPGGAPSPAVAWIANILSALAFAGAHLPSWLGVAPPSAALAVSVLALNAIGGTILGYIFVTRGIAAAVVTHAGADCAIQLLGPLTG